MKRFVAFLVAFVLTISALPFAIGAEKYDGESLVVQFEDGSYITEEITLTQFRVRNAVSGRRVRNFYNSSGNLCWKITLCGVFSYDGSSATCTSSSCDVTLYSSDWYVISKSAGKSGNSATASVTMGELAAGATVNRVPVSLTLKCDGKGNVG